MNFFNALIHNTVFMSAVTGWFAAQVIKTVIYTCITKSFDPERLVGSGGMPSSASLDTASSWRNSPSSGNPSASAALSGGTRRPAAVHASPDGDPGPAGRAGRRRL